MMNRRIYLSIFTIIFALSTCTMVGTLANTSDNHKTDRCIISTGKLGLVVNDGSTWQFSGSPIIPGESTSASFTVTDVSRNSNRRGYLFIQPVITNVPSELNNYLKVIIVVTDITDPNNPSTKFTVDNAYANPSVVPCGVMYPGDVFNIVVTSSILSGSTYNQGQPFSIDMICKLNQKNNANNI